jgi:hypothetical protein
MASAIAALEAGMHGHWARGHLVAAAAARDAATALAVALRRKHRIDDLRRAGRLVLAVDGVQLEINGGRLVWTGTRSPPPSEEHLPVDDETAVIVGWIQAHGDRCRLLSSDRRVSFLTGRPAAGARPCPV